MHVIAHVFKCTSIWPREGLPVKHGGNMQCTAVTTCSSLKFKGQVKGILLIIMKCMQYLGSRKSQVRCLVFL